MATNPILQQIAQLLAPNTTAWAPGPFTPPFNPNAPAPGAVPQQPVQMPQVPVAEPATEQKPKSRLARVGAALTDPRMTAFMLGTSGALNQPRQQGQSQMQHLTQGVLGGYGGLQNLAMMQEAARQQQFKERLAIAEVARQAAATQSQIGLQGAQTGSVQAKTANLPKETELEERRVVSGEREAGATEERVKTDQRRAGTEERRVQLAETQMMEQTAQAKKEYQLEVDKLRQARVKHIDERKLAEMRVNVDKQQNNIAAARLDHEAKRLKADLEAKGDARKAALVDSAKEAAKAQVTLMNSSLADPMSAKDLEDAYVKHFNRYVQQFSLGTGIPMNLEAFGGAQGTPQQPAMKFKKGPDGRAIRITGDQ